MERTLTFLPANRPLGKARVQPPRLRPVERTCPQRAPGVAAAVAAATAVAAGAAVAIGAAVAAVVVGLALVLTSIPESPVGASVSDPAPIVGEYTGEHVDGLPVYRLPPVDVVAGRGPGLADTPNGDRERAAAARP